MFRALAPMAKHVATLRFPLNGSVLDIGEMEVESEASWPSLIKQVCQLAGSKADPSRVTLRLRAPEKGAQHPGFVFPGDQLMVYVGRCVDKGCWATGFSTEATVEVDARDGESEQDELSEPAKSEKPASAPNSQKTKAYSDYLKVRPQALFWTPDMMAAYQALPESARNMTTTDDSSPPELLRCFLLDKHRKHLEAVCAAVRSRALDLCTLT